MSEPFRHLIIALLISNFPIFVNKKREGATNYWFAHFVLRKAVTFSDNTSAAESAYVCTCACLHFVILYLLIKTTRQKCLV